MVWVKNTTSLKLGNLCCHGYNNKDVVKVKEQSWSWLKNKTTARGLCHLNINICFFGALADMTDAIFLGRNNFCTVSKL